MSKIETGFTSISVSKKDFKEYDEVRKDFAKKHNISEDKVSMAMLVNTAITFYKQRMKYGTEKDRADV